MHQRTLPWYLFSCASLLGASLCLTACYGSDSEGSGGSVGGHIIAGGGDNDAAGAFRRGIRGYAEHVELLQLAHGRSVDVYSLEADDREVLVRTEVVIDPRFTAGPGLVLDEDEVRGRDRLRIAHPEGSEAFARALAPLEAGLVHLAGRGAEDMVPRDATLVLTFDDALDPATVGPESVRLEVGVAFTGVHVARVLVDPGHLEETGASMRVLVDLEVDPMEAERAGIAPTSGLPAAESALHANVLLRLPTVGRHALANLAGRRIEAGGVLDESSATQDRVLALRSGGATLQTGDANQGLLGDVTPPRIVGTQFVRVLAPPTGFPGSGPNDFVLPQVEFVGAACAQAATRGDVLRQPGFEAIVSRPGSAPQNGIISNVVVRLVQGDPLLWPGSAVGSGHFLSAFEPTLDVEPCFVEVTPTPVGFPGAPDEGLATDSVFTVAFSEPMDPASLSPYDAASLTRVALPAMGSDYVVTELSPSVDLREWSLVPALPLAHQQGSTESYFVTVRSGAFAPTDLAGNPLAGALRAAEFHLDAIEPDEDNGGRVLRFRSLDDEPPFAAGGALNQEVRGQFQHDPIQQELLARPVIRFDAVVDPTQDIIAGMTSFDNGVSGPLVPQGAKLQTVWRYPDVGFSLGDSSLYNIDIEGLNWAPLGGSVIADHFDEFEVRLSHARALPDEYLNPASLFPAYPDSGLEGTYADNIFGDQTVVHPRTDGYTLNPGDVFASSTGTVMMPFPLNEDLAPGEDAVHYTWRDTGLSGRAASDGNGAELDQEFAVAGMVPPLQKVYPEDEVPSVGLPLLMEFRTYPTANAMGLNAMRIALGTNSSIDPTFRAFSAGGVNQSGTTVLVDPDLETQANGGFNQNSNPPGQATPGRDNTVFFGSMDLVVRVSRATTVWFPANDTSGALLPDPTYALAQAVTGPLAEGTGVELAYRGATLVTGVSLEDASVQDAYGDYYASPLEQTAAVSNPTVTFGGAGDAWASDLGVLDGSPYHQIRITFVANAASREVPTLQALGMAWAD